MPDSSYAGISHHVIELALGIDGSKVANNIDRRLLLSRWLEKAVDGLLYGEWRWRLAIHGDGVHMTDAHWYLVLSFQLPGKAIVVGAEQCVDAGGADE